MTSSNNKVMDELFDQMILNMFLSSLRQKTSLSNFIAKQCSVSRMWVKKYCHRITMKKGYDNMISV